MKSITADLSLLITAIIWGSGFIASQYAIDSNISTSLILLFRFTIASIALLLIFFKSIKTINKGELLLGVITGVLLYWAFYFQTVGLKYTTPSNNAFITAVYVILVPFITWIAFKKKPQLKFFFLTFSTFIGVAILTYSPDNGISFNKGDALTLVCAFLFALHISFLDVSSKRVAVIKLTFLQMATAAILSLLTFGFVDHFSIANANLSQGFLSLIYLGLFSTMLCFFIQTFAQKYTSSTKAALFLSSESLFGSLFSVLLKIEPFTINMVIGGFFILFSIFASEITSNKKKLNKQSK